MSFSDNPSPHHPAHRITALNAAQWQDHFARGGEHTVHTDRRTLARRITVNAIVIAAALLLAAAALALPQPL